MTMLRSLSASFFATAALAASASLALAIPAHASAPTATARTATANVEAAPSVSVAYGDLNLDTPAGRAQLHHRIVRAASDVCEDWRSVGAPIEGQVAFSHCRDVAVSHATARLAEKLGTQHLAMH